MYSDVCDAVTGAMPWPVRVPPAELGRWNLVVNFRLISDVPCYSTDCVRKDRDPSKVVIRAKASS